MQADGMIDNPRKEQIGRQLLVTAIKENGIEEITALMLPSAKCSDVHLLNKFFGKENVQAVGFEKDTMNYEKGVLCKPSNLIYLLDATGKLFKKEAFQNADKYNVIDFEFCGSYGSPNHVNIEEVIKLAKLKAKTKKPNIIGITYDTSCGHFGKDKSLLSLGVSKYNYPIKATIEDYLECGEGDADEINFNNCSRQQQNKKIECLAIAQIICSKLAQGLFAAFPPNKNGKVIFNVKSQCYLGSGGLIMLRIIIVLNGKKGMGGMGDMDQYNHCYLPSSNMPSHEKTKHECLKNMILWFHNGKMPKKITTADKTTYCANVLFGFSERQVVAWHTINFGSCSKNKKNLSLKSENILTSI